MIKIQFDGAITHNPGGKASYGWLLWNGRDVVKRYGRVPWATTSNQAEYHALIEALKETLKFGFKKYSVLIEGDSQLVIKSMQGRWKVKNPKLRALRIEARMLARQFKQVTYQWIPREMNEADALSRLAI